MMDSTDKDLWRVVVTMDTIEMDSDCHHHNMVHTPCGSCARRRLESGTRPLRLAQTLTEQLNNCRAAT